MAPRNSNSAVGMSNKTAKGESVELHIKEQVPNAAVDVLEKNEFLEQMAEALITVLMSKVSKINWKNQTSLVRNSRMNSKTTENKKKQIQKIE